MFDTFRMLGNEDLNEIMEYYSFCKFRDGSASGDNNKLKKYNLELSDTQENEARLHDLTESAIRNCTEFGYVYTPKCWNSPSFLKYEEGMHYAYHNDYYHMNGVRTDFSVSCFLNSPEEYEGGELVLHVGTHEVSYKLDPGMCVIYPTGTLHKVNPVISGERKVMVFWVQSLINDSRIRSSVIDISKIVINHRNTIQPIVSDFEKVRYNLIREFS